MPFENGDQSAVNQTFSYHLIDLGEIAPFLPEIPQVTYMYL